MIGDYEDATTVGEKTRRGSVAELGVVFGITVALPVALGLASGRLQSFEFGQSRLLGTVAAEAVVVAILWPWLASRGWDFRSIAGAPVPMDAARGVGVAVLAYAAYYISAVTWAVFVPLSYDAMKAAIPTGAAAPWVVVLVSVFNPTVEEFLWLGYGVTAMRRYGSRSAVSASILLRVTVHAYQGILALTSILPLAIVFTIYFARTKRLWPVIVAHMLFDAVGLLAVLKQ